MQATHSPQFDMFLHNVEQEKISGHILIGERCRWCIS